MTYEQTPKKVCIVSALPRLHSGLALYTKGLISGFSKRKENFELVVIANKSAEEQTAETDRVRISKTWSRGNVFFFQILSSLIKEKPNIVHFQHEFFLFGGMTTAALFPLLLVFCKALGMKTVVTMHGVISKKAANQEFATGFFVPQNYFLLRVGLGSLTTLICKLADVIIVHSQVSKQELSYDFQISVDKIRVVPHGVGVWKTKPSQQLAQDNVLFFGNITPSKGLEPLISGFQKINVPNAKLVIAGGPHPRGKEYFKKISDLVQQSKKPESIEITGYVADEKIHQLFEECSVAVFPYTFSVSCSGGLSFALQHKKPIIVSSLPSFTETITDGVNGLVVPPNDDEALAEAIEKLLLSAELRDRISVGVAQKSLELEWYEIAKQTVKCYLGIV